MRKLFPVLVTSIIFSIGTIYTLTQEKLYEASGIIAPTPKEYSTEANLVLISEKDSLQVTLNLLESNKFILEIQKQLQEALINDLLAPYDPNTEVDLILRQHFKAIPMLESCTIRITYRHPDPHVATKMCNQIMDTFINWTLREYIESSMSAVDALKLRLAEQTKHIERIEARIRELEQQTQATETVENFNSLKRELEVNKGFRDALNDRLAEEIERRKEETGYRIVDFATAPTHPIRPNVPLQLSLWSLASLVVGGASLIATVQRQTVLSRDEDSD